MLNDIIALTYFNLVFYSRFGRQKTAIFCYVVVALGGFVVGIVQYVGKR